MISKKVIEIIISKFNDLINEKDEKIVNLINETFEKIQNNELIKKEINDEISNFLENERKIFKGISFEEYKKERDLKDQCLLKLNKEKDELIEINQEENIFLKKYSGGIIDPRFFNQEYRDIFSSLMSKNILISLKDKNPNSNNGEPDFIYIQNKWNLKII